MLNFIRFILLATLFGTFANAQDMEIGIPKGWTATQTGIVNGNNELSVGPVLDIGKSSPAAYLTQLAEVPTDEFEITSIGEIKDGVVVAQVVREVLKAESKARSTLFICKGGRNKHRLLELFTDDVFALISGGRAAISFCSQS